MEIEITIGGNTETVKFTDKNIGGNTEFNNDYNNDYK